MTAWPCARIALTGAILASALLSQGTSATARVPAGFVGVVADGPLLDPGSHVSLARELKLMRITGVGSVRATFLWSAAQPHETFADVPPGEQSRYVDVGGVPTDFGRTDRLVRQTAKRGLRLLPAVLYAPAWASSDPGNPGAAPSKPGAYARFLGALARRYGTRGSFWARHPRLRRIPIRDWQAWSEPNIPHYWRQPFAKGYVKLLRAVRSHLRSADRRARVILAGLTNDGWNALSDIYRAGGRRYFDVVALHPYTRQVNGLVKILAFTHDRMRRFHDGRKPIIITELSWPSAAGKTPSHGFNEVTESQQAKRVSAAYKLLAKYRRHFRIQAAYWYTWLSRDRGDYYFSYSGLRKMTPHGPQAKPAFRAFRRVARRIRRSK